MMKTIFRYELGEGARYSQPLYIEDQMFLPAGVAVTAKDIAMLDSLGISELSSEGARIEDAAGVPAGRGAAGPAPPAGGEAGGAAAAADLETPAGGRGHVFFRLGEEIKMLDAVFASIALRRGVKPRTLWAITATLLQLVKQNRAICVEFVLGNTASGFGLAKSSINTAVLTAMIAEDLGVNDRVIPEYVSAALLHDAGMLRVPPAVLNKQTPLSNDEKLLIQSHAAQSFHIAHHELRYPALVGIIILQHHERWDGLGYPNRLSGAGIEKGACILAVADAFEAMVCAKPYRNSKTAYQAMKTMISENSSQFSPKVLQAFIKLMGIYPAGSLVLLNNGARARVLEANKDAPLRPRIAIISGERGEPPVPGETVDLLGEKSLYIAASLPDESGA